MSKNTKFLIGGITALAALLVVLLYFQPQKLFIDERVEETAPVAVPAGPGTDASEVISPRPPEFCRDCTGNRGFRPLNHDGEGTVSVINAESGKVVRFENFSVENGPDLYVYLSSADPMSTDYSVFDDDFVSLGKLKGNQGNQNYAVPAGVDLEKYDSVVVWCQRFSSGFAVAPLPSN